MHSPFSCIGVRGGVGHGCLDGERIFGAVKRRRKRYLCMLGMILV